MQIILFHRRITGFLKLTSFFGVLLILYFVYISFKSIDNEPDSIVESSSSSPYSSNLDYQPQYEITLHDSTFEGVSKNLAPYKIQAGQVIKTLNNKYKLNKINVLYSLNKDNNLVARAKDGILNEFTGLLKLKNEVKFLLGDSVFNANEVQINLATKEILSDSGIILSYKNSKITSNNFSSINDNTIINFAGRVSTVIDLSDF